MAENGELYEYLHKLAGTTQETIDAFLSALWSTRRTGLRPSQLSHFQSLLNISSPSQLLPVTASLRSLIRKCVYEDYDDADVLRMFPPDLPSDLAEAVVVSLRNGVNGWKEELHSQKNSETRSELSHEVKTSATPFIASFLPSGRVSESAGTCQDDPVFVFSSRGTRTSSTCTADFDTLNSSPLSMPRNEDAAADTAPVPFVSSMTWTLEKQKGKGSKVAVVTLKLQIHSNSPALEKEVKIQLTTENVETMYKSMVQIDAEFSTTAVRSLQPLKKKQKQ